MLSFLMCRGDFADVEDAAKSSEGSVGASEEADMIQNEDGYDSEMKEEDEVFAEILESWKGSSEVDEESRNIEGVPGSVKQRFL